MCLFIMKICQYEFDVIMFYEIDLIIEKNVKQDYLDEHHIYIYILFFLLFALF